MRRFDACAINDIKAGIGSTARAGAFRAIATSTGVVGLLFLLLALFISLSSRCVVLGALFVVVAQAAALMRARGRRIPAAPAAEPPRPSPWWLQPWMLARALRVVRIAVSRRTSVVLVVAMASGFLWHSLQSPGRPRSAR